ncbi:MAG: hypothetical protein ACE5G0_12310, partial [Rhodothermales bacterium]
MLLPLLLTTTLLTTNLLPLQASPQDPVYLYKVTLVRAAPGKLLDLIALQKDHLEAYAAQGDAPPFWMRHSQGDQWDLMLIFPMESYAAYYHPDRLAQRKAGSSTWDVYETAWNANVARQEDLFVYGPSLEEVQRAFEGASFFHVEMFRALPGQHEALYEEREMENAYLAALNRPQNMIFVRDQGAAWDVFTLGFYRDIKHFAESA